MATLKQVGSSANFKKTLQEGMYARWEISAALTGPQSDLVMDLATLVAERPLPELPVDIEEESLDLHRQESVNEVLKEKNYGGTVAVSGEDTGEVRIDNSNQFFAWFAQVEAEMDLEQEAAYRQHLGIMRQYLAMCDDMMSEVDETLNHLSALGLQYDFVSTKTQSLHTACEHLLADQTRLVEYADGIGTRLQYFVELERLTLRLNSPSLSVLSASFIPLLRSLDSSISYVASHSQYKDSDIYLTRLNQLQNKALVLVKMHTVDVLRKTTLDTKAQLSVPGADTFTVIYAKYGVRAPSISPVMEEMGQWGHKYPGYHAVLTDTQACYFTQRLQLVSPIIQSRLNELNNSFMNDLPTWLRTGCAFLQRICQNEYQLYHRFFHATADGLGSLMESLTEQLYDTIRPFLIKLTDNDLLAELCDIVATEILSDISQSASGMMDAFANVIGQILEDLQDRLVYRSQAYLRLDVGSYQPTPEDLNYPDKLEHAPLGEGDVYSSWYPTMHKTLLCLSMLYRCVEKKVFEGISHEAIGLCRTSLVHASNIIAEQKGKTHGQLFLIKHLLTLREQIAPFDVDFVLHEHSLDFNNTRMAMSGLLTNTSHLFSFGQTNSMLRFVMDSAPTVREQRIDSKKDLDLHLKRACEAFIADSSSQLTGPMAVFLKEVADYAFALKPESEPALSSQSWAGPETVKEIASETLRQLKKDYPKLLESMGLYLRNRETEWILFKPIK
eukprot:Ihof_evm2s575 gene=Ihof_evmTU2s575